MINKIFKIKGMHCASCSAIITKKISKLDGIKNIDVNFAIEKANIYFDGEKVDLEKMNNVIEKLGYSFSEIKEDLKNNNSMSNMNMEGMDHSEHLGLSLSKNEKERELNEQKAKIQFVLPLSLFIFVIMMWDISSKTFSLIPNLPIPMDLFNIISMILSTIVLFWIGLPFISGVVRFVKYRVANMDTLIGI